jgi:inosose dehydratase
MFGGGDPLEPLRRYQDRIWHVHFKDFDPSVAAQVRTQNADYFNAVQSGIFCELGKGAVDFPAVVSELQSQGYDGWIVVEQDVLPGMGRPKESAARNRQFLQQIGL